MEYTMKENFSQDEKEKLISKLTYELAMLRTKADVSQEELANIIGISRQTYSSIERGVRQMAWGTYLSLIWFFDSNNRTHELIHMLNIFPTNLINTINARDKQLPTETD